ASSPQTAVGPPPTSITITSPGFARSIASTGFAQSPSTVFTVIARPTSFEPCLMRGTRPVITPRFCIASARFGVDTFRRASRTSASVYFLNEPLEITLSPCIAFLIVRVASATFSALMIAPPTITIDAPARRLDRLEDRRIVRDAHHGDHVGPGLRRDLRLERAGIHRFQVGDDRLPREGFLQLAHDLHPFGLDQRRPGLEPVRPSLDGLLRREEGPLPMHVVQGDLQDGLHGPCLPRAHDKYVTTRAHVAARVSKEGYETAA